MGNNMGKQKKPRLPPRQVWLVVDGNGMPFLDVFLRRKDAQARIEGLVTDPNEDYSLVRVAGPYVLAERVGQR